MKKAVNLLLGLLFVISFCACNASTSGPSTIPTDNQNTATATQAAETPGTESTASTLEPIRFSIFHPDSNRKIPPDDAVIVQQVFKKTGVMLDWIIPPADANERLNIMLASDELPDLIEFSDATMMDQFIEADKLLSLDELMSKNAPQAYTINYVSFRDRIRYKDGKMYFLPGRYDFGDASDSLVFPESDTCFSARTGLLEELGWYNPKDFDAIFKLLQICKEKHPEMSPMALALGPQGHLELMNGIGAGAYGLTYDESNIILTDGQIKYFSDVPQMKQWYAFLNKIHRAGLLDVESAVMSQDMLKTKVVSGKVFSFFGPGWEIGSEFITYSLANGSNEQIRYYFMPRADDTVDKVTYCRYTKGLYTTGLTLTKDCKDPARFFKFYEFMNTEEGWFTSHGVVNWDFTGENTVENTKGYDLVVLNDKEPIRKGRKLIVASAFQGESWGADENWWWNRGLENFGDFKYVEGNHPLGKYDYVGDRDVSMWWDARTTEVHGAYGMTGKNYAETMTKAGCDISLIAGLTLDPSSDEAVIQLKLNEYIKTQLPRIIIADSEEAFETQWQEMVNKLNADGKQKFVDKKSELYKQRLKDWNVK